MKLYFTCAAMRALMCTAILLVNFTISKAQTITGMIDTALTYTSINNGNFLSLEPNFEIHGLPLDFSSSLIEGESDSLYIDLRGNFFFKRNPAYGFTSFFGIVPVTGKSEIRYKTVKNGSDTTFILQFHHFGFQSASESDSLDFQIHISKSGQFKLCVGPNAYSYLKIPESPFKTFIGFKGFSENGTIPSYVFGGNPSIPSFVSIPPLEAIPFLDWFPAAGTVYNFNIVN